MRNSVTLSRLAAVFVTACLLPLAHAQGGAAAAGVGDPSSKHFDPLGQPASKFTIELRNGIKAQLPFSDQRDFEEAKRGFIAEPPYKKIMADGDSR
jgi:alkyl sulfatase BDS1-like metallo-beta-lactamase superfamily hydrolase